MSEAIAAGFQLSPQQKHLSMLQANEPAFHSGLAVLLEGKLDADELQKALHTVIARHEIFRTSFHRQAGMKFPVQVVSETVAASWEHVDLRPFPAEQQSEQIEKLFQNATRPSSLEKDPSIRATLIAISEEKCILLLSLPSLCADARTLGNLLQELCDSYASQSQNQEEVLQYADFSAWQNDLLEQVDDDAAAAREYWSQLAYDSVPAVKLPFEARPEQAKAFESNAVPIDVPSEVVAYVQSDPRAFLAACWHVLQWRLTWQTEIVVGHVADGRNHAEQAAAMGLFAKSLPIVYKFDGSRSFADVMEDVQSTKSSACTWQDYLKIDEASQDLSTSFAVEEIPAKRSANGVQFSILKHESISQRFRMQLRVVLAEGAFTLELRYDPQFFSRTAAEGVARHFAALMRSAAQGLKSAIRALQIMSAEERQQVLVEFNRTAADYARESCFHYLFEQQAEKTPDQDALRFGDISLTYAELNAGANRLAHLLRRHGVKADVPVGLCMERSADMIIALLGILKAGGAYVPLVPDNPKARLSHQLSETKSPVLITEERFLKNLPEFSGQIICLDRDQELLAKEPTDNPTHVNGPHDMAYVIYTSGSTGLPKGVAVRHSNLVNYTQFVCRKLKAEAAPLNFATVSTLAADLGNTSIFPSLASGGCLHVIAYETAMAGNLFADYVKRHPIDVLKITPSHLGSLLSSGDATSLLPRRFLILGGEASSWDLVRRIAQAGKCSVINHYGPTETTIGCCTFDVAENNVTAWAPATVPIGRPISNAQVYILDETMQPVPVGVPGELCIGGAGVAKGYLNQPQQTAEKFVADSFSKIAEARLYRSGDLARFLPDGNVEFLGRMDQQVKIRGFRVEPAEIESVLKQYNDVQQAIVVSQEDKSGDKRLVAYVVSKKKPAPTAEELRSFLQTRLPEYMVPTAIVNLESLPLTQNGKVDVSALPSPDQVLVTERLFIAPRNPVEEQLSEIWREVLGVKQIGVQDNFFDVGGHSLLATQVISRVRSTFRVQLSLRSLFDSPTVAGLANEISQLQPESSEDEEVAKLLRELEGLSDEEAERLLANELQRGRDSSGSGNH